MIETKEQHDAAIARIDYLMDELNPDYTGDPKVISELEILTDDVMVYEYRAYPDFRRSRIEKRLRERALSELARQAQELGFYD